MTGLMQAMGADLDEHAQGEGLDRPVLSTAREKAPGSSATILGAGIRDHPDHELPV